MKQVAEGDCPHLLFYGPSGAGKKTLILTLLREIFGAGAEKLKPETKEWKIERPTMSTNVTVEITTLSSMHHIELNPSDAGLKDKYIVQVSRCFLSSAKGQLTRQLVFMLGSTVG